MFTRDAAHTDQIKVIFKNNEPLHDKSNILDSAPSEGFDKPVYLPSMISHHYILGR